MPYSLQSLLQPCFLALSDVAPHGCMPMDPGESVLSRAGEAHRSPKCGGVQLKSPRNPSAIETRASWSRNRDGLRQTRPHPQLHPQPRAKHSLS